MTRLGMLIVTFLSVSSAQLAVNADDSKVDYVKHIKPILKARCYSCHGALKQESGLRLDTGKAIRSGSENGRIVDTKDVGASSILERITATDESERMPPEGKPLTSEQIKLIKNWIAQGANSPADEQPEEDPREHWAFKRPVRPQIPQVKNQSWVRNSIDAFIAAEHDRRDLVPVSPASKHVLLRRVYLDLIGMPPTRDELKQFLADDSTGAYQAVVDRLLQSKHYGERWGRHWMDVWRYSDWYGRRQVNDVRNSYPHIWRWRDWIIDSLNQDKGYDQMLREMLAADELHPDDDTRMPALGFIVRNWFSLNYDTWKMDLVEHTGKAFLGLRLNCAHCHDHKYDPITQEEYFKFRAFFEPIEFRHDRVPGGPALTKYIRYSPGSGSSLKPIEAGLPRIYDHTLDAKTFMYRLGDTRDRMDRPPVVPAAPAILGGDKLDIQPVELPPVAWYPGLKPFAQESEKQKRVAAISTAEAALAKVQKEVETLKSDVANAERELADAKNNAAKDETKVDSPSLPLIGYWRFEGTNDKNGFLADSSGNGHHLTRVTGQDPVATPTALKAKQRGAAFFNPIPSTGTKNQQAAEFQQNRSFAYLATKGSKDFYANTFSVDAYVNFDVSQRNYNRTIADYEGCWTFLHRGIDAKSFELRVRCFNPKAQIRDVATGSGKDQLILQTGHDYYVSLVVSDDRITLHAVNLTKAQPLETVSYSRSIEGADFSTLSRPPVRTPFKIGNSDGTGRVDGLIDEVRYSKGVMTEYQIATATGQSTDALVRKAASRVAVMKRRLELIPSKVKGYELQVAQAKAELAAIEARLKADNAKFKAKNSDDAATAEAIAAEKNAKTLAARAKLAKAQFDLSDSTGDAKKAKKATADIAAAKSELAAAEKQALKQYTPFGPQYPQTSTGRRRALALWLAAKENPLTARVAVNHIWMRHFGRPFVESVADFGRSGTKPSHPKLIDWLAVELMNPTENASAGPDRKSNDWGMKHIHRLIVTSNTYRMSSNVGDSPHLNSQVDQDNKYLWRFDRQRMQAEIVRDSMLAVSGQLDRKIGGQEIDPKLESESYRRSLYFAVYPEAGGTMRFMTMFDSADPCDCYRRTESIVPQQALAMSNSKLSLNLGRQLTKNLSDTVTGSEADFVAAAFEQVLSRPATPDEKQLCVEFLNQQQDVFKKANPKQLATKPSKGVATASSDVTRRARESLMRVLLNHNDFITIH